MADTKDLDLSLINAEDTSSTVVSKLNENFNKIDRHNHTEGTNDVRSSGFIVNSDIDMTSFSLLKSQLLQLVDLQTKLADPNFIVPNNSIYSRGKQVIFKDIDGLQVVIGNTAGGTGIVYDDTAVRKLISDLTAKVDALETGGLSTVASDDTLTGDGSTDDPLKVAVPYSESEKNKLAALDATDLPVGARTPVIYTPSVIYHDPNKINGDHLVSLSEVIAQIEANNALYTTRQTGSFVPALNFNPLTVETVTYGTVSAKALVVTYNGNLFETQQLIKFELIDSTGELSKEYLLPPSTIQNGFDYVVSDALADSSIHKKEVRFRITYDSGTNKTKIFIHQRPVADPPPAVYLFIVALYKVEALSQKGEAGSGTGSSFDTGRSFPSNPVNDQEFMLLEDISGYKSGFYFYKASATDWELVTKGDGVVPVPADGSITRQKLAQSVLDLINSKEFTGYFNRTRIYKQGEIFDIQGTFIQVISATWQASVDSPTFADNAWRNLIDNSVHRTSVRALTFTGAVYNVTRSGDQLVVDFEDGRTDKNVSLIANLSTATGSLAGSKITDNTIPESKLDLAARTKLNSGGGSTTTVIVDGSVTTPKLANFAVTTDKLAGGAVSEVKLLTSVAQKLNNPEQQIVDGEFNGSKLTNNTVAEAKLDAAARAKLNEGGPQGYQGVFQVRLFTQITSSGAGSLATPPATPDGNWEWHEAVSALRRKSGASVADANYRLWQAQVSGITPLNGDIWVVLALWNPATGQTSAWSDPIATDPDHAQATAGIPGKDGVDGRSASTLFSAATDKLTNNNITDNTISGNKLQDNTLQGRKLAASSVTNSKIGVGISGNKIANLPESSLDTAARTKLNAAADLGTATGNLAGSKISDNSIAGTKLANLTIPSSKLGANSVTNSKVSNGIAGSKISNIPESSLSSGVQTKLNASGGGGGASVATDAQFATGSDTLAPSVNQSKSYADSKDAFLVLWEGQFGNASADNVTTIGNKATISGLNEYDATNDRQTITKGSGAGNNTLIEWENPNIDARRATFLSELTMNNSNWTMSAQIGYTSLAAGDNALEIQQGGWGFLCTRSPAIIGSNAGIFGLSLFVGQGGSLGATVSPREIASSQRELRGGALAPNGNNPYVRLPYDTQADKVILHVERIGRLFRVYTDGILRMIVSLNDAQAGVPGNSGKFGYAGNPSNTGGIRYYLLKAAVGNTVIRPLSGAGGGSSTVADNSVSTAKIQNLAVTGPKIASNAVVTTKIANGAVTGPKIDANAIDATKIFNGSVTEAKLSRDVQTKLNAGGGTIGYALGAPYKLLLENSEDSFWFGNNEGTINRDESNTNVTTDFETVNKAVLKTDIEKSDKIELGVPYNVPDIYIDDLKRGRQDRIVYAADVDQDSDAIIPRTVSVSYTASQDEAGRSSSTLDRITVTINTNSDDRGYFQSMRLISKLVIS